MRLSLATLALASLAMSLPGPAQTKACGSLNDATNNSLTAITGLNRGGPGRWAFRWIPSQGFVARGGRIFTGTRFRPGFMSFEIWDEGSSSRMPGKRLAGGTWWVPNPTRPAWLGANFDKPVVLLARKPVWLVWIENGWNQVPYDPSGTQLPLMAWNHSTSQWVVRGQGSALKFRLFCSLLDAKNVTPFGGPCAASSGKVGTVFTNAQPVRGSSYRIEGSGFPAGAPALFLLGFNARFPGLRLGAAAPGCSLNTDIALILTGVTGTGNVRARAAFGHVAFNLPLPGSLARDAFFAGQIAVLDAKSNHIVKLAFGNALRSLTQ